MKKTAKMLTYVDCSKGTACGFQHSTSSARLSVKILRRRWGITPSKYFDNWAACPCCRFDS